MARQRAVLALENGFVAEGFAIGANGVTATGELVFNTAMTGYQEILTDPSYKGQIVTFTYPHIGNYGINSEDVESDNIQASGLVVEELSRVYSNFRASKSLQQWLEESQVAGIEGVDTRSIVRILRSEGAQRCVIAQGSNLVPEELVAQARQLPDMNGLNLADGVSTKERFVAPAYAEAERGYDNLHVAAIDFGMKRNIVRRLQAKGCTVTVFPSWATAEEILEMKPDGVFLSNGPGDPAAVTQGINTTKALLGKAPMFGICLGHQIMALAVGARTYKMKFGHRGANHPVKNLMSEKIEITSQNHGFAVDTATLPDGAEVTHINLNDNTCAGIRLKDKQAFAVQYHPEASPGPHDADYLFEEFVQLMRDNKA